jgi:hypothetical protein
MRKFLLIAAAAVASAIVAGYVLGRRRFTTWGVDPLERELPLPGDDLVPEPTTSDTRGLTIEAPPSAVWPWLVQLGYGRGGWYSYDAMDMKGKSTDAILPEFQTLAVGDTVPTDPKGGFEAKVVEPEHALVLFIDQEIAARRMATQAEGDASTPAGLAASGRFMQASVPPEFAVSWAIVLQPLEGGRTRLIERVRAHFVSPTPGTKAFGPMLGFGVFVMTRRQMLGLADRAERLAKGDATSAPTTPPAQAPEPAPGNGHAPELVDAAPAS